MIEAVRQLTRKSGPAENLHEDLEEYAVDDQSEVVLDAKLVKEAAKRTYRTSRA